MAKKKPNPLPLFQHRNGQWAKKVRGKLLYFGTDKDAALKRWADEKDYLLAGRPVPARDGSFALFELGDQFIHAKRTADPPLSERSIEEYRQSIARLVSIVGREYNVEHLGPFDFSTIRTELAKPIKRTKAIRGGIKGRQVAKRSPITVGNDVRRLRVFFSWCVENELIRPPRYGGSFAPLSAKESRRARSSQGNRSFASSDLQAILAKSSRGLRPIILLAINAGIGQADIASIRLDQLPAMKGDVWIDLPRRKTGAQRRFILWPETRDAIKDWLAIRPDVSSPLAFVTVHGSPWMRDGDDAIGKAFTKARVAAGVVRGTFYDLRRTFQTVADETLDFRAVSFVMGHVVSENDMPGRYNQAIGDDRIKKVCYHVRDWFRL